MIPMVHRMPRSSTNPRMRRMTPSTIMEEPPVSERLR
jgi:hypothetical protein